MKTFRVAFTLAEFIRYGGDLDKLLPCELELGDKVLKATKISQSHDIAAVYSSNHNPIVASLKHLTTQIPMTLPASLLRDEVV